MIGGLRMASGMAVPLALAMAATAATPTQAIAPRMIDDFESNAGWSSFASDQVKVAIRQDQGSTGRRLSDHWHSVAWRDVEGTMRIAVYGGSFNPPHVGHAMVVSWLLWTRRADRVWLVPAFSDS